MSKKKERPNLKEGIPYAKLVRESRWGWSVSIIHGVMRWGPEGGSFYIFGTEKRARKVSERLLRKYIRQNLYQLSYEIITVDDYEKGVAKAQALAELQNPVLEWDREFLRLREKTDDERNLRLFRWRKTLHRS